MTLLEKSKPLTKWVMMTVYVSTAYTISHVSRYFGGDFYKLHNIIIWYNIIMMVYKLYNYVWRLPTVIPSIKNLLRAKNYCDCPQRVAKVPPPARVGWPEGFRWSTGGCLSACRGGKCWRKVVTRGNGRDDHSREYSSAARTNGITSPFVCK